MGFSEMPARKANVSSGFSYFIEDEKTDRQKKPQTVLEEKRKKVRQIKWSHSKRGKIVKQTVSMVCIKEKELVR